MVSGTELVGALPLSIKIIFLSSLGISLLFLDPIDPSNTSQSIGNGFPVQKYIGAMVRKSTRVILIAENEAFDDGCFSSTFQICPETQDT